MNDAQPMRQPRAFWQVDSVTHNGVVIAFGEEWDKDDPSERRLWYRVLDLEQTADQDLETSWEDATRWTRWFEVPWPTELRAVGMSLLTVDKVVDQSYARVAGRWKALDDGTHLYLFRALDLTLGGVEDATRVYANRYRLTRLPSPGANSNGEQGGKREEFTVPQLVPVTEARYRRSAARETPETDTDSQGTRNLVNDPFVEPTMEWSMLRPLDGAFTVTLTPSSLPGRRRWQFFCQAAAGELLFSPGPGVESEPTPISYIALDDAGEAVTGNEMEIKPAGKSRRYWGRPSGDQDLSTLKISDPDDPEGPGLDTLEVPDEGTWWVVHQMLDSFSFLRDDDGWADLDEKAALFETEGAAASRIAPDAVFPLLHPDGPLQLQGRPASATFRIQEQSSPLTRSAKGDQEQRALSGQRVMLASRTASEGDLAVVDFSLDSEGAIDVEPDAPVEVSRVDFARTALWLSSSDDRVTLKLNGSPSPEEATDFAVHAWVRHDAGSGTLLSRWEGDSSDQVGWALEWRGAERKLVGYSALTNTESGERTTLRVQAEAPTSFTWHHLGLVRSGSELKLFIDGRDIPTWPSEWVDAECEASDGVLVGGPAEDTPEDAWLDFRIDQVVLWATPKPPSMEGLYYELDQTAQDGADTLGCWTFDGRDAAERFGQQGADLVSQTAPLFSPSKKPFERYLGGMSTGMGLLDIPHWSIGERGDPQLFVGSDGIVRLYTVAYNNAHSGVAAELVYDTTSTRAQFALPWTARASSNDGEQNEASSEDGEQNEASKQSGQFILQAREPGPVMNRAVITLKEAPDKKSLCLEITHDHRSGFGERWINLPTTLELTDLIAIINGQPRPEGHPDEPKPQRELLSRPEVGEDPDDADLDWILDRAKKHGVISGPPRQISSAIDALVRTKQISKQETTWGSPRRKEIEDILNLFFWKGFRRGGELDLEDPEVDRKVSELRRKTYSALLSELDEPAIGPERLRADLLRSELVQAFAATVPDNGAPALVQPTPRAVSHQQGNFTGWTRPPLAVSGDFDDHALSAKREGEPARLDDRLKNPGDFSRETWISPEGGKNTSQTIFNWRHAAPHAAHDPDKDLRASLSMRSQPGLRFAGETKNLLVAHTTDGSQWLTDGGGATITARVQMPTGPPTSDLRPLAALSMKTSLQPQEFFAKQLAPLALTEIGKLESDDGEDQAAKTKALQDEAKAALRRWRKMFATAQLNLNVQMRLAVRASTLVFSLSCKIMDDGTPEATKEWTTKVWTDFHNGKPVRPKGEAWSVACPDCSEAGHLEYEKSFEVPIDRYDDESLDFEVELGSQPLSLLAENSPPLEEHSRLRVAGTTPMVTFRFFREVAEGDERTESASYEFPLDPDPNGTLWLLPIASPDEASLWAGCTEDEPERDLVPFSGTIDVLGVRADDVPVFAVDFTKGRVESDGGHVVTPSVTPGPPELEVPQEASTGRIRFAPTLDDRRYETVRTISPPADSWLHTSLVCSDSFALRFGRRQLDGSGAGSEPEGDRAAITDAGALSPDRAFTIDCVVVPQGDSRAAPGTVFAKTTKLGEEAALCFQLSIDAQRRAHLRYSLEIGGETQIYETWCDEELSPDRPYHVVASVALQEVFLPRVPPTDNTAPNRRQLWFLHHGVWVYDTAGSAWLGGKSPEAPMDPERSSEIWESKRLKQFPVLHTPLEAYVYWLYLVGLLREITNAQALLSVREDGNPLSDIRITATDGPAAIGAATGEDPGRLTSDDMDWFSGLIGSVRLWRSTLTTDQLRRLPLEVGLPSGVDRPTAWWRFDERRGLVAEDSIGGANATLTREEMWVTARDTARLTFYLNGRALPLRPTATQQQDAGPFAPIDYGRRDQLTFGAVEKNDGSLAETFRGKLDDIRLWDDVRTGEEILDNMHVRIGGNEDDLVGWWPLLAGVGGRIKDCTTNGRNHLKLEGDPSKFWGRSSAPVGDDLPQVHHLLGDPQTVRALSDTLTAPMATEYGDIQTDAEGKVTGVQKRAIVLSGEKQILTATGFKTGDLDLIYVGQVQSSPTLIGYIEGAPPVPSENLTRPYWTSPIHYNAYSGNTSITLREAESTQTVYTASYDRGLDVAVDITFGLGTRAEGTAGFGAAFGGFTDTEVKVFDLDIKGGSRTTLGLGFGMSDAFETSVGTTKSTCSTLSLGGSWTDEGPEPRRYEPDNVGYALVKSSVANLHAMRLRRNGAMLGLAIVPDPDIPEDFNIITFQIDPSYTRQGTLDGRILLEVHPDERIDRAKAEQGRGSYFRPLEAANIEAQIEAYEARLLAAYDSFNASPSAAAGIAAGGIAAELTAEDPGEHLRQMVEGPNVIPFDWARNLSRRNIVNTYVWNSSGGFFAEETNTSIVRSESSGGSFSFQGMHGVHSAGHVGVGFGAVVGPAWDVSALFGMHLQTTVIKSRTDGRDFGLDVNVICDDLLKEWDGSSYSEDNADGKVESYRFKSFFLVPDKSNFEQFWSDVVDPDWLNETSLDAVALRQAKQRQNQVWRVLHRVTYVQRVPPSREQPPPPPAAPTRTLVHQGPNWQNIAVAKGVLKAGKTADGASIDQLPRDEQLAAAADELVRSQWGSSSPWWKEYEKQFAAYETEPSSNNTLALVVAELRRRTYEYLRACSDAGFLGTPPEQPDNQQGGNRPKPSTGRRGKDRRHRGGKGSRAKR